MLWVLGVEVIEDGGNFFVYCEGSLNGSFVFELLMVGGIYNVILVVVLGEGMVMLENVFIDIDVVDVIEFLNVLGVCIEGVGINMIIIYGVKELYGGEYIVIFDCIEVGIFMMLVVVICLWFMLINVCFDYLCVVISKFVEMGVDI